MSLFQVRQPHQPSIEQRDDLANLQLTSQRLVLLPISLAYAGVIFQEFTADITRYLMPKVATHISETTAFIHSAMGNHDQGKDLTLVILKSPTREFLGLCGVTNLDTPTPELGIWLKKSAHGHHFGREAIHLLKGWIDRTYSYDCLLYPVDRRNIASRKIAESLGGQVHREYQQTNLSGDTLEVVEYRVWAIDPSK
jgi:[ribosomal protein S5]-alanine N-acetyltransferase